MSACTDYSNAQLLFGNSRVKLYKLNLISGDTTCTITPGLGFNHPVGAYTSYTLSQGATGGSFAFTVVNPAASVTTLIAFFSEN
jgi:hypothetical protein